MAKQVFILTGDGVTDDSDAMQALSDGERVFWPDGEEVKGIIKNKKILITRTIIVNFRGRVVKRRSQIEFKGCQFVLAKSNTSNPVVIDVDHGIAYTCSGARELTEVEILFAAVRAGNLANELLKELGYDANSDPSTRPLVFAEEWPEELV